MRRRALLRALAVLGPAIAAGLARPARAFAQAFVNAPDGEPLSNLDAAFKASLRWHLRDALKAPGEE